MPGESRSWISDDLVHQEDARRARDQLDELNRQLDELYSLVALHQSSISSVSAGLGGRSEEPTHLGGGVYRLQHDPLPGTLQVFVKFPTSSGRGGWVLISEPDEYALAGSQFVLVGGALPSGSKVRCWYVY